MSKAKSAAKPHERCFRLIFSGWRPRFFAFCGFFPVVKCVEVCACQIDRSMKAKSSPKSTPQNTRGVVCPFSGPLRLASQGSFSRSPSRSIDLPAWKEPAQVYRDASFEEKRRIVSALVEGIRVSRDYKIQIMFRVGVDLLEDFAEETGNVTEEAS